MINFTGNPISSTCTTARKTVASIANHIPAWTSKNKNVNKAISWIGKNISSPENRLILGVTALMSQPFIDLSNKKVDEETRKVSAARTVAKIIAGTSTGVLIRYACIKAIDFCANMPETIAKNASFPKLRVLFAPDSHAVKGFKNLTQYKNALGTIVSLGVMVFSNFLIDAPLTKFLTNKFVDKIHKNDEIKKQVTAQTSQNREVANV